MVTVVVPPGVVTVVVAPGVVTVVVAPGTVTVVLPLGIDPSEDEMKLTESDPTLFQAPQWLVS